MPYELRTFVKKLDNRKKERKLKKERKEERKLEEKDIHNIFHVI
jgi:hypothetical protein